MHHILELSGGTPSFFRFVPDLEDIVSFEELVTAGGPPEETVASARWEVAMTFGYMLLYYPITDHFPVMPVQP